MVSIVQDTEGTRGPQSRGSQASVHAANAPPVYATGKAAEPTPNPLILCCPQSLHLAARRFSKYEEARRCFLCSEICVRLLGYVVFQCDAEGNKEKKTKKQAYLFSLIQPETFRTGLS